MGKARGMGQAENWDRPVIWGRQEGWDRLRIGQARGMGKVKVFGQARGMGHARWMVQAENWDRPVRWDRPKAMCIFQLMEAVGRIGLVSDFVIICVTLELVSSMCAKYNLIVILRTSHCLK
jgi:hypothetical protein